MHKSPSNNISIYFASLPSYWFHNFSGIYYRLGGSDSGFKGRVEVAVNGVWGTVCGLYFDSREATVFCRTLGYRDGRVDYSSSYPDPPTSIYQASFWCTGDEDLLENCPHQGWKAATSSYCRHSNDAKVICFDDGVSCLWIYSSLSLFSSSCFNFLH